MNKEIVTSFKIVGPKDTRHTPRTERKQPRSKRTTISERRDDQASHRGEHPRARRPLRKNQPED
jgi:hypothetical protein